MIAFDVLGIPAPQGSKRAFVVGGKARMTESAGSKGSAWRDAVATAAHQIANGVTLDEPLFVVVRFRFPVPKARLKACERAGGELWKTSAPDVDKLSRSVLDALTASALIRDDSLVVWLVASKVETTGWTGAHVEVSRAEG